MPSPSAPSSVSHPRATTLPRREFLNRCAWGALLLANAPILGCRNVASAREKPLHGAARRFLPLNQGWSFLGSTAGGQAASEVTLPHCVTTLSWQDWETSSWQDIWHYRRDLDLPEGFAEQRVFVRFEGVMVGVTPTINGHTLPQHLGGYLPARYELTEHLLATENQLEVTVDSRWSNVPPQGAEVGAKRIDYLEPGGIYRDVVLEAVPLIYISDVFARPIDVLSSGRRLEVRCTLDAAVPAARPLRLRAELKQHGRVLRSVESAVEIDSTGLKEHLLMLTGLDEVQLWDVDAPHLYDVEVTLLEAGEPVHEYFTRTGFREARFELDGFYLNGRRLQIFGLNRHELYPYVGYAMPPRVMRRDAEILKHDFNCNFVRCAHYPQSPAFLDACDELGLLVWEEVPGWGYIGDAAWKDLLVRDTRDMVLRDRNRPSIVIWGTRANESPNDEELYHRTKAMAKSLDDSRPTSGSMTSGTRKTWETKWHEDVFAYDDYHAAPDGTVGILDPVPGYPYMLAEAVGQFNYATGKGFNSYYRRASDIQTQQLQAIRHAQAHSKTRGDPRHCGVVAWCAFEYGSLVNAYRTVKYPGVADVFRVPKLGASFYLSQVDPGERLVIEPNFYWDFGPSTPRGPGRDAAIFSNCDRLHVWVGDRLHAKLEPDATRYPHLSHAPFFVDLDLDGAGLPELRIEGFAGGELAITRSFSADPAQDRFELVADDDTLLNDGADATRVVFRVVDRHGAQRALAGGMVSFELKGPATLLGNNPFNLAESGGVAAVWVRAHSGVHGAVRLTAHHQTLGSRSIDITVTPVAVKVS